MRKIRHSFNMVEIVLAIGVVAFGITGVMALLPPALNANRDVAVDAFVDEAVSKVSAIIKYDYVPQWNTRIKDTSYLPTSYKTPSATALSENQSTPFYEDKTFDIYVPDEDEPNTLFVKSADSKNSAHVTLFKEALEDIHEGQGNFMPNPDAYRITMIISWPTSMTNFATRNQRIVTYDVFPHN